MFPVTYEDVVTRDRPLRWFRLNGRQSRQISHGASGSAAFVGSNLSNRPSGLGLPGAPGGVSARMAGDVSGNNDDGYSVSPATWTLGSAAATATLELWVWPHTALTAGRTYTLLSGFDTGNEASGMLINGSGQLLARGLFSNVASDDTLQFNQWNHCVICVPYTRGARFDVYLNGKGKAAFTGWSAEGLWVATALRICQGNFGSIFSPPVFAAEAAIYNYTLTPGQVLDHYRAGLGVRRHTARLASIMTPPGAAPPPPPPPPGGLTPITSALSNRRLAVVSDRPR
jgi:hypothetical protein